MLRLKLSHFVKGSTNVNTTNHNKVPTVCITHAMYSMGQQWTMKLRQEKECSTFLWFKCHSLAFYYIHGPDYSAYRYQTILILLVLKLKGNGSKVTSAYFSMWINGMLLNNMCATCFITKWHTFTISYPNRPKDLFWFEVLTCFYWKDLTMPMESASHHFSGHMLQYSRCFHRGLMQIYWTTLWSTSYNQICFKQEEFLEPTKRIVYS